MSEEKHYENNEADEDAEIHEHLSNVVTLLARLAATRHLEKQQSLNRNSEIKKREIENDEICNLHPLCN